MAMPVRERAGETAAERARAWSKRLGVAGLALLVGLVYFWPSLVFHSSQRWSSFPRYAMDEEYYGVLAASTARGEPLTGNPYLRQPQGAAKRGSEAITFVPRLVTGGMVWLLGVGPAFAVLAILPPVLLWCLLYALVKRIGSSAAWAAATATAMLLLPYWAAPLVNLAKDTANSLLSTHFVVHQMPALGYVRRFNPVLSTIPFYGFLWLHYRGAESGRTAWQWTAAVVGGLLFYCYFFFAATAALFAGGWWLVERVRRPGHARRLFGPLCLHAALAGPFFNWSLQNFGDYQASNTINSHHAYLPWPHIAAMLIPMAGLLWCASRLGERCLWLATLGGAALLAMNQHVLTGIHIEPWHFDAYVVAPLSTLLAGALVGLWWRRSTSRAMTLAAAAVVLVALAHGAGVQAVTAARVQSEESAADFEGLLALVQGQAGREDVVLTYAAGPLPSWVVMHTGRPVYVSPFLGFLPVADRREYRERALCYYWLKGSDEQQFEAEAIERHFSVLYNPEGSRYWFFPQLLTEDIKEGLRAEYRACAAAPETCCRPSYRLDWIAEVPGFRIDRERLGRLFEVRREIGGDKCRLLQVRPLAVTEARR